MKNSQLFIILLSESLWIYYGIGLFSSVEMKEGVFAPAMWWIIAGATGFLFNRLVAVRIHYAVLISANVLILGMILYQNLRLLDGTGTWVYKFFITIAVSFVFIRAASFVFRKTTRRQMLHRFEGNVIFYALLSLVLIPNGWSSESFHVFFLLAILLSLLGMIFSLQTHGEEQEESDIEIQTVGKSGWFAGFVSVLFIGVALFCALLFLPAIRQSLYSAGISGLGMITWIGKKIMSVFVWLLSLLPETKTEGVLPDVPPTEQLTPEEVPEKVGLSMPIEWIVGIAAILILILLIWFFSKFLKNWKPPHQNGPEATKFTGEPWWTIFKKRSRELFLILRLKWRKKFKRFYKEPIFWYYEQVQKWGHKNGIQRLQSETTKDYVEKLISRLHINENEDEGNHDYLSILRKLNAHYQEAYYYGTATYSENEYKQLLKCLKEIKLPKESREQ